MEPFNFNFNPLFFMIRIFSYLFTISIIYTIFADKIIALVKPAYISALCSNRSNQNETAIRLFSKHRRILLLYHQIMDDLLPIKLLVFNLG